MSPRLDQDRGSILILALLVLGLGGIAASSLLSFNDVLTRANIHHRHIRDLEDAANSSLRLATSTVLRTASMGGDPCTSNVLDDIALGPTSNASFSSNSGENIQVDVTIECSTTDTSPSIPGLIITANSSSAESLPQPSWFSRSIDVIDGAIVINSGTTVMPSVSILPDRRSFSTEGNSVWSTLDRPWTDVISTDDPTATPQAYPPLPPVPPFERPGAQANLGTCTIYFPGRYLGSTTLTLSGGVHYFASGVYYFERALAVTNGAQVVFGSGDFDTCSTDTQAASAPRAPLHHDINGRGATILLGGSARIVVQESSLVINERQTDDNDASNGIGLRTVNFGTSTTAIFIPEDPVRESSGALTGVSTHSIFVDGSATPLTYKSSTLAPATAFALDVRLNGTKPLTNRIVVPGRVFTAGAGLRVASTTATYAVKVTGGVVASKFSLSLTSAPSGFGAEFSIGSTPSHPNGPLVTIATRATSDSGTRLGRAVLDTNEDPWRLIE